LPEDQVPACGVPVDYLFDVFSLSEAISHLLKGDGNCAEVQWQLLGLSMPGWVLVAFIGYAVLGIYQFMRKA
jgi:disulfide bond formation protein DsbB